MIEKTQNENVLGQINVMNADEIETVGVDVYSQGGLVIADLTLVNSLSLITVYDDQGIIVKTVKSNGLEVVKIKVPKKGINQVQIQNGTNLFTQKVLSH